MSDPESDSPVGEPTDPLIAAQIRKLDAEADKAAAEAHRIKVFWTPRVTFQAVIGGVVTAAFIAGWAIGYLRPLLTAGELELQIDRHRATLDSIRNDSVFRQLTLDQEALSRQRDSLGVVVTGLVAENSRSASRLETQLQSQTATQIERDSLEALLEEIRVSNVTLVTQSAALALVDTRWQWDYGADVIGGLYEWHGDGTATFTDLRFGRGSSTLSWAIQNDSLIRTSLPERLSSFRVAFALEGQTSFPIGTILYGQSRAGLPYEIQRLAIP